jgi:hypothetical protein
MAEISQIDPKGYYLQSNQIHDSSKEQTTQRATCNPLQLPTYQYQPELQTQETLQGYLIPSVDLCQSLPNLSTTPFQHRSPESLNTAGQVGIEHHLMHQSTAQPSPHYHKDPPALEAESGIENNINNRSPPDDFNWDMGFDFGFDIPRADFGCEKCSKSFPKRWKLNRHRITHEKPFKCFSQDCNAAFALKKDCRRHFKQKHRGLISEDVDLRCVFPSCKFLTPRRDALKRHLRDVHGIEMKF